MNSYTHYVNSAIKHSPSHEQLHRDLLDIEIAMKFNSGRQGKPLSMLVDNMSIDEVMLRIEKDGKFECKTVELC